MRAVWSLRSPVGRSSGWAEERHHLLAWVLSVMLARAHYDAAMLVTDARGRAVLADGLGLPFDEVRAALDDAAPTVPARIHALRAQTRPFVHLDADVFLWKPLSPAVSRAPLFAQNPTAIPAAAPLTPAAAPLPAYWPPALRRAAAGGLRRAIDCSFIGANFVAFMARFAAEAARVFEGGPALPAESAAALEQYLLAAYLDYHLQPGQTDSALKIAYLFESAESAQASPRAEAIGYTRLGPAGRTDRALMLRLERRVARDYPDYYHRCLRLLAAWRGW